MTTPLGETLSDLIEPVSKARQCQWEAQSTEEVIRKIEDTNEKLANLKIQDAVVGSLDVIALYPSIDQVEGPKTVAQEIRKSHLKFENIDLHLLGVYLGTRLSKERLRKEGVTHLIPRRKAEGKPGRRPTIHGSELGGPRKRKCRKEDTDEPEPEQIGRKLDEIEAHRTVPLYRSGRGSENSGPGNQEITIEV